MDTGRRRREEVEGGGEDHVMVVVVVKTEGARESALLVNYTGTQYTQSIHIVLSSIIQYLGIQYSIV